MYRPFSALAALICLSAAPAPEPAVPFLDAHVHLNDDSPDWGAQIAYMDANAIESAIVFFGRNSSNAKVMAAAERHPSRLLPFASVSPEARPFSDWWADSDPSRGAQRIVAELRRLLELGTFRGIGELSIVHFRPVGPRQRTDQPPNLYWTEVSPLHPVMVGIMDLVAQRFPGLPVLLHCETTYLPQFEALLRQFPSVKVIWAHGGYAPLFVTRHMLAAHPNLTIELSMRALDRHPRSVDYGIMNDLANAWPEWRNLIEANSARFVIGTDASNLDQDMDERKVQSVKRLLQELSPATQLRVAGDNIKTLLLLPSHFGVK